MSDRTWGERLEDACDLAADGIGFVFLMAVVLAAVGGVVLRGKPRHRR
jgi:hypothetical protein